MNLFGRKNKKDGVNVGKTGKEKAQSLPHYQLRVLGVPLAQALRNNPSHDGVPVPAVVRECLDFIALYGLEVEGVFRVSSPKSRLDHLEKLTNEGRADEIVFQDAHEAAGLLKRFLRQLPENSLTTQLKSQFDKEANLCRCVGLCRCSATIRLKELLLQLPSENFHLLAFVFRNVQLVIQKESANKMNLPAMGLLLHAILDMPKNVVKIFITNAATELNAENGEAEVTQLFDSVDIGPYLKPKTVEELQKNPPREKNELENEIKKQQFVLEHLHSQVQRMREGHLAETTTKEETMWKVQAMITMLKRRLKSLNEQSQEDAKGRKDDEAEGVHQVEANTERMGRATVTEDIPSSEDDHHTTTNFALLENQLLAVQTALCDEIIEEKRQIAHLLSVLRELNNKLPEEEQNKLSDSQRQKCDETQKNALGCSAIVVAWSKQNLVGDSEENGKWEEWCKAEEDKRDRLLAELIRYRKICAQLRARLEHDTVLVNLLGEQKNTDRGGPAPADNLLVTRF